MQVNLPNYSPKVPRASVWCELQPATLAQRNLTLIFGENSTTNPFLHDALDLTLIWDESTLRHPDKTLFEWVDLPPVEHMIAGLILVPSNQYGEANVTVCTVEAAWTPTSMWVMPEQNLGVMSNFTYLYPLSDSVELEALFPDAEGYEHPTLGNPVPMVLQKDWADSLNGAISNPNSTLLAGLMDTVYEETESEFAAVDQWPVLGPSLLLSPVVADALGRIGSEYLANWCVVICRDGWCSSSPPQYNLRGNPVLFNGTIDEWEKLTGPGFWSYYDTDNQNLSQPVMYSFQQPQDYHVKWTEISLQVNRYGYGWGFNSKVVKAAAVVLMIHAIIIVAHCCHLIVSGKYYTYAESVGELVALALKSQPPRALDSIDVGISSGQSIWSQPTAVRQVVGSTDYEQQFEIVVGPECTKARTRTSTVRQRLFYEGT